MCSRCHTETDALQLIYKHAHQTQDMLHKTQTKIENIIRKKYIKIIHLLFQLTDRPTVGWPLLTLFLDQV